jgi:ABC-type transporter Mla subunit MlaD
MKNSFDTLLSQIDAFIRKYYKNQLIRGLLVFFVIFLFSFLFATTFEYFGRFNSVIRAFLFFGFIGLNTYVFITFILIPITKLVSFGKQISRIQASEIIGSFFPSISDRLKNTLQLQNDLTHQEGNIELLRASVNQRSSELSVIPFKNAIKINENKRYLTYLIPLLSCFILIAIFIPTILTQGTEHVVYYNKAFKEQAPYLFQLKNSLAVIEEGTDFPIELTIIPKNNSGEKEIPNQVFLVSEQGKFLLFRKTKNSFIGSIKKPKKNTHFYFTTNQFDSKKYQLNVIGKSLIGRIQAFCTYPSYLGKQNELIENVGDLTIPEGTQIEWKVQTKNTVNTSVFWNQVKSLFKSESFKFNYVCKDDKQLKFVLENTFSHEKDTVQYKITVVKDAFPTIEINEKTDSISEGVKLFTGLATDDYGLKSLQFIYKIIRQNGQHKEVRIPVQQVIGSQMNVNFAVDFKREEIQLKDKIEYYFVVYDNDGVNGSKAAKSQLFTYELPGFEELNDSRQEDQNQTKEDLDQLLKKTKEFQKNITQLKKETLNAKSSDWNKLNKVQQLKEEQSSLLESLEKIQNEMEKSVEEKNQLSPMDQELLEKQDMIEKLLEELMDDELKKLLDDLEKLLEQNDKEQIKEKMEELNQSSEDMKKQLDRSLEMLKKMQLNERIDDIEKELKELAKEQDELRDELNKERSKEELTKKQEELNKKFDELKKDLQNLNELNKESDKPMDLGNLDELQNQVSDDLQEAKDGLEQGKEKKAGEKQKSASEGMNSMANQLNAKQQQANKKEQEEDMKSLRNILESLMTLSFDQEALMNKFNKITTQDPVYRKLGRRQQRIIDETKIIKDSLLALAKRQPKIASFIDRELNAIESNHQLSVEDIDDHRKKELNKHQQLVMTSYNNLALLLNEALQSMQSQMQSEMEGSGSCNNPGKGKPKPGQSMSTGDMKEMLKKQLEKMQKGQNPGGEKPGDKPGNKPGSQPGSSPGSTGQNMLGLGNKEMAKMAAEQTAIRQRLEQLRNEMNKSGKGLGNQLNPLIKELEEQEKNIINKNSNKDLVNRQKEILTRLLESEKALMERGYEEKRESKSGKDEDSSNKIRFDEYNKTKLKEIELLKSADPSLKLYYKEKANQYFNINE